MKLKQLVQERRQELQDDQDFEAAGAIRGLPNQNQELSAEDEKVVRRFFDLVWPLDKRSAFVRARMELQEARLKSK